MKSSSPSLSSPGKKTVDYRGLSLWLIPLALALTLSVLLFANYRNEGDSQFLVRGVLKLKSYFDGKTYPGGTTYYYFPLSQHITGYLLSFISSNPWNIYHGWAIISTLCFLGSFPVLFFAVRKSSGTAPAWIACLVLLTGPYIWYAPSTFGEAHAAFATLLYVAALLLRWPIWVAGLLFWSAGITKDIAPPFLTLFWIMTLWLRPTPPGTSRLRQSLVMSAATLATIASNCGFNYFRWGVWYNPCVDFHIPYFSPHHFTFFLALWFSPNGGLLIFWPTGMLVILLLLARQFYRSAKHQDSLFHALPALAILATFFGLTAGLGAWYSPFGWDCWGTRLLLPWLPALLLLTIGFYPAAWAHFVTALGRRPIVLWVLALATAAVSLPHVIAACNPLVAKQLFIPDGTPSYPHLPYIGEDSFYPIMDYMIWHRHSVLLDAYRFLHKPTPILLAFLWTGTIICILAWLWWQTCGRQRFFSAQVSKGKSSSGSI